MSEQTKTMTEETEQPKPKRGRPRKDENKIFAPAPDTDSKPCPVCQGGWVEIEEENEDGETVISRIPCDYCGGTGMLPKGPFEPDDVTDEDIAAIEQALGYTSKAWGFVDERAIIAAAANRMGSKPVPA